MLNNGELLCPTSTEHAGWRVHFEFTKDDGETWERTSGINEGAEIRAIQPSVLFHENGKLQAIGRTIEKRLFETWSTDNGRTWSEMTLTNVPNPNSGTDAITLKNGKHLLIFNPSETERSPICIAESSDGKNWETILTLETNAISEYSYPAIIQTNDGKIHVTYTWNRKKIRYCVIN